MHPALRPVAICLLAMVAIMNMISMITAPLMPLPVPQLLFQLMVACLIWGLLLWKVWTRPRTWGPGTGTFLFFMLIFQTYLWTKMVTNPGPRLEGVDYSVFKFLLHEIPLALAAVSCLLLKGLVRKGS